MSRGTWIVTGVMIEKKASQWTRYDIFRYLTCNEVMNLPRRDVMTVCEKRLIDIASYQCKDDAIDDIALA